MADRDRDDELVVRDRRGEADERQRLHHLASRDRQRRERREHDDTHVHLRHGGADVRNARARLADERLRHRHDRLLPQRRGRQLHALAAALRHRWVRCGVRAVPGDRDGRLDARQRNRERGLAVHLLEFQLEREPVDAERLHADRRRRRGEHGDAGCVVRRRHGCAHRRRADGQRRGRDRRRLDEHVERQLHDLPHRLHRRRVRPRVEHAHARLGAVRERRVRDV